MTRRPVLGWLLLAGLAVAGAAAPAAAQDSSGCASQIRSVVTAKMKELGVPGVIVSIDAGPACRLTEAFGIRDVTKPDPIRPTDHVRVGSITKTFTGTVVLQLADEGRIKLDDPIARHLPGVPNGDAITIRQMLNMTSGLYNYSEDKAFNASLDKNPERVWTPQELLAIAFAHPPYFAPGAGFHYSNTNSVLLGLLVERITGQSLAQEVDRRIFKRLNLTNTSMPTGTAIPAEHPRGYMFGTNVGTLDGKCDASVGRRDVTAASPSWTWSAGNAISTVADLTVWVRALATGALLTPAMQAERLKTVEAARQSPVRYGLHIANFSGMIGHDGALPGFQTFMGYVPARNATIIVTANVFVDSTCGSPADAIVKSLVKDLGLLGQ